MIGGAGLPIRLPKLYKFVIAIPGQITVPSFYQTYACEQSALSKAEFWDFDSRLLPLAISSLKLHDSFCAHKCLLRKP